MAMMLGRFCVLQELRVGDFVLPADAEKITEASEMEVV